HDYLNAWCMEEPRFRAGRMERTTLRATTGRPTNDHRHRHTRAPVHLACHVDDLVEATGDEVDELHLRNGTHAHQGRPYSGTDDGRFRHRRIYHALGTKLLQETGAYFECAAVRAYIFSQEEYGLITSHLFANSLANGF